MANTANIGPIKPAGGMGGTVAADAMTIPSDPSNVWQEGDIVQIDGTTRDALMDNTAPAINTIFGVAATKAFTANATIDRNGEKYPIGSDALLVHPA